MVYEVQWNVAYEGLSTERFATLKQVKEWVKENGARYDDLTIYEISREIDIYSLMKED